MEARDPPGGSKRDCVKEVFHNALHRVEAIKPPAALWPCDPRPSRSFPVTPSLTTTSLPLTSPAVQTRFDGANQTTNLSTSPQSPCVHCGEGSPVGSSPTNALGANAATASSPLLTSSGSTSTSPRPRRSAVWALLSTSLEALERSTRSIHPLNLIARAILDCLEVFESAATDDQDRMYETLAGKLNLMENTLNFYAIGLDPQPVNLDVKWMAEVLQHCKAHIGQWRKRSRGDQGDIANCRHQMELVFGGLQAIGINEVLHRTIVILQETKVKSEDDYLRDLQHVGEASYNSRLAIQLGRRSCMEGTRKSVKTGIDSWALSLGRETPKILLLEGGAGTGKSTISYTTCEGLKEKNLLGASYFCTRASSLCSGLTRLIPTLAYQLACLLPAFRSVLCEVLKEHPDSPHLEPRFQFERLLSGPLQKVQDKVPQNLVIVIDGLDESEDGRYIQPILQELLGFAANFPIKIFITSRPGSVIIPSISVAGHTFTEICLDDIDPSEVRNDIKNYLIKSLAELSPKAEQIEHMTTFVGDLFICAVNIVEYVLPHHGGGDRKARLETVLRIESGNKVGTASNETLKPLYSIYSTVLEQAVNKCTEQEMKDLQLVLWTVVCAKEPMTIKALAILVCIEEDRIATSLNYLKSVLHVPKNNGLVTVRHKSFCDFLRNPPQPTVFQLNETAHNLVMAECCFKVMKSQLRFNICDLESSFIPDSEIPDLQSRINEKISTGLFYGCRYWSDHLQHVSFAELKKADAKRLRRRISRFLSKELLPWMEVLNLRKYIEIGSPMLSSARLWLLKHKAWTKIEKGLFDARNFFTRFASNRCSISTAHIYISALPSCPTSSFVYKNYWPLTQRLLNIIGSTVNRTQDAALATWPVKSPVSSLACSPDGSRFASGSRDGTIWLWNLHTGTMMAQIQEHNQSVGSIKISRDGRRLASGSDDQTICLYDVTTTTAEFSQKLTGHQGPVSALDFSPNNACIVSGSGDRTLRLWNAKTGAAINEPLEAEFEIQSVAFSSNGAKVIAMGARMSDLEGVQTFDAIMQTWSLSAPGRPSTVRSFSGHTGPVRSVDLSPDGTRLVTGSDDRIIRMWRADTGAPIGQLFQGHTAEVLTVKFLPDGTRIISGSSDQTVQVWDTSTSSPRGQPFKGHSESVGVIVPIPGDTRVLSGSHDATIRLWDAETVIPLPTAGPPIHTHSGSICSVTFSPDGNFLLSGSEDKSARVWDVRKGVLIDPLIVDYADAILSVAYSPDNLRYAAGSRNGTFLVGDIHPGPRFGPPVPCVGHQLAVQSVAFSADGSRLVTASEDRSIRTWDSHGREMGNRPFTEHSGPVTAIALARRGDTHLVASGSGDKTIRLHDTTTGTETGPPYSGHGSSVLSVDCSPNGDYIVSGSYDNTIRVWDNRPGAKVLPPIIGHSGAVRSVALFDSRDGHRTIVSGSNDKTVRLWNGDTGEHVALLEGHSHPVWSVAFSKDGKYVASGSADGELRLWDTKSRWARESTGDQTNTGPKHHSQNPYTDEPASWVYCDDGWITSHDGSRLLFWVPPVYHHHLRNLFEKSSLCSLIISKEGSYGVESLDLSFGEEWSACFRMGRDLS